MEQAPEPEGRVYPFGTAGDHGWTSGAGSAEAARTCEGCGEPVTWRDLRHGVVERDGRVLVEVLAPWHPGCAVRARRAALAAASRDLVEAGRIVGRGIGGLVPPLVAAVGTVVEAGVPVLAERGRAAVAAAGDLAGELRRDVRRRWRRLPTERVVRPVVERATQAVAEWRRGMGYTRAWRRAFDGVDDVGPVVAPWEGWDVLDGGERFRPGLVGWDGRHAFVHRPHPSAGEAGPPAGVRLDLDGWFRAFGPTGHGDVDTPSGQREYRRGTGQDQRWGRLRPGQE